MRKGWLESGGVVAAALILITAAVAGLTPMATATAAAEPVSSAQGTAQAAKRCIKVKRHHPAGQQAGRCRGEPQDPHHLCGQRPRQQRAGDQRALRNIAPAAGPLIRAAVPAVIGYAAAVRSRASTSSLGRFGRGLGDPSVIAKKSAPAGGPNDGTGADTTTL